MCAYSAGSYLAISAAALKFQSRRWSWANIT